MEVVDAVETLLHLVQRNLAEEYAWLQVVF